MLEVCQETFPTLRAFLLSRCVFSICKMGTNYRCSFHTPQHAHHPQRIKKVATAALTLQAKDSSWARNDCSDTHLLLIYGLKQTPKFHDHTWMSAAKRCKKMKCQAKWQESYICTCLSLFPLQRVTSLFISIRITPHGRASNLSSLQEGKLERSWLTQPSASGKFWNQSSWLWVQWRCSSSFVPSVLQHTSLC